MLEREGQVVVRADLPGMSKDDIKVEVSDGLLTIQGERKNEKKEEREGYCYSECSFGTFYRAIPLPEGAEASKATADFRNGVLEVTVPAISPAAEGKTGRGPREKVASWPPTERAAGGGADGLVGPGGHPSRESHRRCALEKLDKGLRNLCRCPIAQRFPGPGLSENAPMFPDDSASSRSSF